MTWYMWIAFAVMSTATVLNIVVTKWADEARKYYKEAQADAEAEEKVYKTLVEVYKMYLTHKLSEIPPWTRSEKEAEPD